MSATENFTQWIGKSDTRVSDLITPRLQNGFAATLGKHLCMSDNTAPGIHWCLAPPMIEPEGLGPDGHPAKGGFLPPVPLPRRMWASGEIEFLKPLKVYDHVEKISTIDDISWKEGRSGQLCFVNVGHNYIIGGKTAIMEKQNIVYRAAATQPALASSPDSRDVDFDHEWHVPIDSTTMFRYSALTFNGHRIHYDEPYATNVEFYLGLVIHGPLQATLMLNLAVSIGDKMPSNFKYRGVSPATGSQTLRIGANKSEDGLNLSVITAEGVQSMTGSVKW